MNRFFYLICVAVLFSWSGVARSQVTASATPFEYPVAPDTCTTLESRCNFIVVNFWNNYNIAKPITDDAALDQAFRDYVNFFKYAHRNIVMSSVRDFVFKARANTANLSKLGHVAEGALYGPYAEYWSDELYIEIAKLMSESTGLKANERNYYKHQVELISKNLVGNVLADFEIVTTDGKKKLSSFDAKTFILFFTDSSIDSSIQRTRLSTDVGVNNLIESSGTCVIQVSVDKVDAFWLNSQPANWINGSCEHAVSYFDLRTMPSCIILDSERKILVKNASVDDIKNALN